MTLVLWCAGYVVFAAGPEMRHVGILPIGLGTLAAAATTAWFAAPPNFLKPRWLAAEEQSRHATALPGERVAWPLVAYPLAVLLGIIGLVSSALGLAGITGP
jgi:hypothetical protein